MIWSLLAIAIAAFVFAFTRHTPGWLAVGLAVGVLATLAAALLLIDRHVRASGRPEHMTQRELDALKATLHTPAKTPQLPPTAPR